MSDEQLQHQLKILIVPSTSCIRCYEINGHDLLQQP